MQSPHLPSRDAPHESISRLRQAPHPAPVSNEGSSACVEPRALPYRSFVRSLDDSRHNGITGEVLEQAFNHLIQVRRDASSPLPHSLYLNLIHMQMACPDHFPVPKTELPPSYNVVLTKDIMMIVPRSCETCGPLAIK